MNRKHDDFVIQMDTGMTVVVKGDPGMNPRTRAAFRRVAEAAAGALARGEFDSPHRRMGHVERELRSKQHLTASQLYYRRGRNQLSVHARRVLSDASYAVTGMFCGVNDYWLPQIMSEAIEACEALGL